MDYTLLGGSGLKVSSLCFGLGTFGGGTEFLGCRARPAFPRSFRKRWSFPNIIMNHIPSIPSMGLTSPCSSSLSTIS